MADKTTTEIAEQVSLLMQVDRTHRTLSSKVDMAVLANLPAHIASVFEEANVVNGDMTPGQAYALINRRVSEVQAQLYLMRLEMENRDPHDPASIYEDPLVISAYGERIAGLDTGGRSFGFDPEILATGWYPMEVNGKGGCHRWMRPSEVSVACVPHLGQGAQTVTVKGYVMHADQLDDFAITAGKAEAEITVLSSDNVIRFEAVLTLSAEDVRTANYLPLEFRLGKFKAPNALDMRPLGANVHSFICAPLPEPEPEPEPQPQPEPASAPESGEATPAAQVPASAPDTPA